MRSVSFRLVKSPALHPHLIVEPPPPPKDGCKYHLSLQLPDSIFVDRDEIKDLWSTETVSWSLSPANIDIERPITALDIPLHTRYLRPNAEGREEVVVFAQGAVQDGWACGGIAPILSPVPLSREALSLSLPTGNTAHQPLVLLVTPVVIWLGWTYLVRKVKNLHRRIDTTAAKTKTL